MPVKYIPHPIRADAFDLIAARAYAGNYQNLRLRPIVVVVTSQHTTGGAGQEARAIGYIDPPPGPAASAVAYSGWLNSPGAAVLHGFISFHVPPGWVYRVLSLVAGGGANALNEWWEWWL